jgi:photosystem II stability/assembly factor-like uncharacterized protein
VCVSIAMMLSRTTRHAAILAALAVTGLPALGRTAVPFGNLHYRAIGPAISGGRTTAVVGSDSDPMLYYAGGADGGVYKSTDGGASWTATFDDQASAAIGAIAVAPGNASDVWAGTGESNPRNDAAMGDGIYHSIDGAKTWAHAGLDDAGAISSISVDPRDPRIVAVGALGQLFRDNVMRGVFVTHDGGKHWQRTLYVGPSSGVSDLLRVPGHPASLIAGVYPYRRYPWTMVSGGMLGGLYRSDDNGATWHKVSNGLPAGPTGRIGLSASGARIYAIVESKEGALWRSDDSGKSWKKMPHSSFVGGRPFYFSKIFADPADPNRVIDVGLILSLSMDGGRTFHAISENAGGDYHFVWWSRNGQRLIVGSDQGITLSGNGSRNWWQPYNVPFSQPYHIGLGPSPYNYRVCIGLQDNDSWCAPSTARNGIGVMNRDWYIVAPGDGMWSIVDPSDLDLVWSTSTNDATGQVFSYNERTQQAREVSPYSRANGDEAAVDFKYRTNWDTPIAFVPQPNVSPLPPARILAGANVVFESNDRGQNWVAISPDLTRNDKAHQQISGGPIDEDMSGAEISDTILDIETTPLAPEAIWVGTDDGVAQLTRDSGAHWTNVTPPGVPPWGRVAIEPGHASAATAYASVDRHMMGDDGPYAFASDDYGATWSSIAGDLPKGLFLRCIREDAKTPNLLFGATQRGIYVTMDRGRHWRSLRLNMPATAIYDLQIQPVEDDLVAASHGRGAWILDDIRPLEALAASQPASPAFFAPREAVRMWRWAPVLTLTDGTLPDSMFVGENAAYGALLSYYLPRATKPAPVLDILDASGRVVRHLTGDNVPNAPGIQRTNWDLNEDGPAGWKGTYKINRGPSEGAEVVPGIYTARLIVDGRTYDRSVTVVADPRDEQAAGAYQARHDYLAPIFSEIGAIDTWLNATGVRSEQGSPPGRTARSRFQRQLTYNPRTDEDLSGPLGLRERLLDLINRASSSFAPPNAAQLTEAAELHAMYERLSADSAQFVKP